MSGPRHVVTDPTGTRGLPLESDPLDAIRTVLAFSSRDWGQERDLAWLYGIVLGWDADEDDQPDDGDAMSEVAYRFSWDAAQVARLRELHKRFKEMGR